MHPVRVQTLGVNISSSVKNKPLQDRHFNHRRKYAPFGPHSLSTVIKFLSEHNITMVRQILCVDEVVDGGILRKDYLEDYAAVSRALSDHGIQVLLDFHQDLFSRCLGGCGLPQELLKSPPSHHIKLRDRGKMWGAVPVFSQQQERAWTDFFTTNSQQQCHYFNYVMDVLRFLLLELGTHYYAIDLINEPGCGPTRFMQVFLNKRIRHTQQQQLSNFYDQLLDRIHSFLLENHFHEKLIIEPFNYDVSQILYQRIGLVPLQVENSNVIFGPHVYSPSLFSDYRCTIKNHLIQQRSLNIRELVVGEMGDLSLGKCPDRLVKQLQLVVVNLDIPALIWEFDPNQNSNAFANPQDCYPWNCEEMSIVDNGILPSLSGMPILNWWHAQSSYKRRIVVHYVCAQTVFESLRGKELKVRFQTDLTHEIFYKYVFVIHDWKHKNTIQLETIRRQGSVQFVCSNEALFCFATFKPSCSRDLQIVVYKPQSVIVR